MRALFVNTGILGHASVARLIGGVLELYPDIDAVHLDLVADLTLRERVVRKLICWGVGGANSMFNALTLARWRRELHAGIQAARRIRQTELVSGVPDVLHFHTQATAYASLRRMQRTPSIVSIDITQRLASAEAPRGAAQWQYAASARHDRRVFQAARAIISTSQWAAADLVRDMPECASRVHVMPYPVPLAGFDRAWIEARRRRAANGKGVCVLFVGGDFPRKGGVHLLDAWQSAGLAPTATLRLVTDWPLAARDLPPGVEVRRGVRAYTPEWFECWREADVLAMPTTGEAFGMVFQEAGAAGLPSIGTRLNAIPEIVTHDETGLLVNRGDVPGLAAALRRLARSADLRRTMGTAARAHVEATCSPQAYGDRLVELLYQVTGAQRVHNE